MLPNKSAQLLNYLTNLSYFNIISLKKNKKTQTLKLEKINENYNLMLELHNVIIINQHKLRLEPNIFMSSIFF